MHHQNKHKPAGGRPQAARLLTLTLTLTLALTLALALTLTLTLTLALTLTQGLMFHPKSAAAALFAAPPEGTLADETPPAPVPMPELQRAGDPSPLPCSLLSLTSSDFEPHGGKAPLFFFQTPPNLPLARDGRPAGESLRTHPSLITDH